MLPGLIQNPFKLFEKHHPPLPSHPSQRGPRHHGQPPAQPRCGEQGQQLPLAQQDPHPQSLTHPAALGGRNGAKCHHPHRRSKEQPTSTLAASTKAELRCQGGRAQPVPRLGASPSPVHLRPQTAASPPRASPHCQPPARSPQVHRGDVGTAARKHISQLYGCTELVLAEYLCMIYIYKYIYTNYQVCTCGCAYLESERARGSRAWTCW